MIVNLIDDQRSVRQAGQHLLGLEVGDPNMAHLALIPCADQRGHRLLDGRRQESVHEEQVYIIGSEPAQAGV